MGFKAGRWVENRCHTGTLHRKHLVMSSLGDSLPAPPPNRRVCISLWPWNETVERVKHKSQQEAPCGWTSSAAGALAREPVPLGCRTHLIVVSSGGMADILHNVMRKVRKVRRATPNPVRLGPDFALILDQ